MVNKINTNGAKSEFDFFIGTAFFRYIYGLNTGGEIINYFIHILHFGKAVMSNPYKNLGGQALIYGLGNIVPRLLNYAVLTVYYTRRFPPETYGVITELYAYVAILLVILTYGMETGLFKFSGDQSKSDQLFIVQFLYQLYQLLFYFLFWCS